MSNINLIVVEGRLTADPVLSKTKSGKIACTFAVANNRYYFQGKNLLDEVSFFKIKASGPLGERVAANARKGTLVLVSGTICTLRDGTTLINAVNIKLISSTKKAV